MIGIENIKKILIAAIDAGMIADKLLHKEGVFTIFQFTGDFAALAGVDFKLLKQEVDDLTEMEKMELIELLRVKLVLYNKQLEGKIESGAVLLVSALEIVKNISALVASIKKLLEAPQPAVVPVIG